jgi:hypothetical protein
MGENDFIFAITNMLKCLIVFLQILLEVCVYGKKAFPILFHHLDTILIGTPSAIGLQFLFQFHIGTKPFFSPQMTGDVLEFGHMKRPIPPKTQAVQPTNAESIVEQVSFSVHLLPLFYHRERNQCSENWLKSEKLLS